MTTLPMLLFDLDGTLWDSATQVAEAWNIVIAREEPSFRRLTAKDIHAIMGLTMDEIQLALAPELPEDRRTSLFRRCSAFEVNYLRTHSGRLYPDLLPVLRRLHQAGYPMAVVSNCQCGYVEAFLHVSGTGPLFADFEEWERTGLRKGENIRLVMRRNHADHAVYIGDTAGDQEAARFAGIPFIHAAYGFGQVHAPDGVIHSLPELPAELKRLFAPAEPVASHRA